MAKHSRAVILRKSYIIFQNITYKLFIGIIKSFMVDQCTVNNIITPEQPGGKQRSWGCTDKLLINKMILDETNFYNDVV